MKNEPSIEFTPFFNKQRKAAPLEIKKAFRENLLLFIDDPDHSVLRNHALKGKYTGYRSIDVIEDWRAIFKVTRTGKRKIITLHMLGTHKKLYR